MRGLEPHGPGLNQLAFAIDGIAALAAFVGALLVIRGAAAASQRR